MSVEWERWMLDYLLIIYIGVVIGLIGRKFFRSGVKIQIRCCPFKIGNTITGLRETKRLIVRLGLSIPGYALTGAGKIMILVDG